MNKLIVHTSKCTRINNTLVYFLVLNMELYMCNLLYRNCTIFALDEQDISLATLTLKTERGVSSKMSTAMYPLTRCHIPKYLKINRYHSQKFIVGTDSHPSCVPSSKALYQTDTGQRVSSKVRYNELLVSIASSG
jgi:hypothetical protein